MPTFTVSHCNRKHATRPIIATLNNSPQQHIAGNTFPLPPRTDLPKGFQYQRDEAAYAQSLRLHARMLLDFETTKASPHSHMCMVKCLVAEGQRFQRQLAVIRLKQSHRLQISRTQTPPPDSSTPLVERLFSDDEEVGMVQTAPTSSSALRRAFRESTVTMLDLCFGTVVTLWTIPTTTTTPPAGGGGRLATTTSILAQQQEVAQATVKTDGYVEAVNIVREWKLFTLPTAVGGETI